MSNIQVVPDEEELIGDDERPRCSCISLQSIGVACNLLLQHSIYCYSTQSVAIALRKFVKSSKDCFRFYKVPTLPAAIVQIVLCTAQISELKTFTIQANCQHAFITFSKSTYRVSQKNYPSEIYLRTS